MNDEQKQDEKLPAEVRAGMLADQKSMLYNVALFEHAQRVATMYSKSTMIPDHFKNNPGNCFIALNYAQRIGADEFMVMQNMYVVHGRPGIEGKLVIALVNNCGKYKPPGLFYEERGDLTGPKKDEDGMRAYAVDKHSGARVDGPWVTWAVVKNEGWLSKPGSKWKTMPEIMFTYRAASWFANRHCPEVKMGMATVEELHDIVDLTPQADGAFAVEKVKELEKAVEGKDAERQAENQGAATTAPREKENADPAAQAGKADVSGESRSGAATRNDIDWDPLHEIPQKRYGAEKMAMMTDWLEGRGVEVKKSWPGNKLHNMILDIWAEHEGKAYRPVGDDAPPYEPPVSESIGRDTDTLQHKVARLKARRMAVYTQIARHLGLEEKMTSELTAEECQSIIHEMEKF